MLLVDDGSGGGGKLDNGLLLQIELHVRLISLYMFCTTTRQPIQVVAINDGLLLEMFWKLRTSGGLWGCRSF